MSVRIRFGRSVGGMYSIRVLSEEEKPPGIIGGITIISLILAGYGIYSAIIGFRERERSYLTCKIGIVMNAAAIISFFAVFIRGLN